MKKPKTEREKQLMKELGEANNKLRWFFIYKSFQCKLLNLDGGWYEKVSTGKTKNDKWIHSVKHKRTGDTFTVSDFDYLKIIDTFKDKNEHLI